MQPSEPRDDTAPAPAVGIVGPDPFLNGDPAEPVAVAADPVRSAAEPGAAAGGGLSELISDIKLLAGDAKTLAEAELAYQTSRAKVAGSAAQGIAASAAIAGIFALYALLALVVGLLLALTPLVSAWGATAIVTGLLAVGAAIFLMGALRKWRRLKQILAGDPVQ